MTLLADIRAACLVFLTFSLMACQPENVQLGDGADLLPLAIVTSGGERHEYRVELARTAAEQNEGLMYRQSMAADRGMLFPFSPPRQASFWMKNTYIPLDMIFIAADGRIESVASDTVPLTTAPYRSRGQVAAVLELNAGEIERIGAKSGDYVEYRLPDLPDKGD